MSRSRVGGIAAAWTDAFRPYSDILSALTGVCYWWGWVPTCGVTAILSATAISQWCLPGVPVPLLACTLVVLFTTLNLCGIKWVTRAAVPIASPLGHACLHFYPFPVLAGTVDWRRAVDFHLTTPFDGWFGQPYLAYGGTLPDRLRCAGLRGRDLLRRRNSRSCPQRAPRHLGQRRYGLYLFRLPSARLAWRRSGPDLLGGDLGQVLGPTFAPLFGALGKAVAMWFMMLNMFHGTHPASRRRRADSAPDRRGRPRPSRPGQAHAPHGCALGCDGDDGRVRDRVSANRRSGLADRCCELHLSNWHLHAERGSVAATP